MTFDILSIVVFVAILLMAGGLKSYGFNDDQAIIGGLTLGLILAILMGLDFPLIVSILVGMAFVGIEYAKSI